jgi:hypothetical protein
LRWLATLLIVGREGERMRNRDQACSALTRNCVRAMALGVWVLLLLIGQLAFAQTETILHDFGSYYGDGSTPYAPLAPVFSSAGEFTGTTSAGGDGGGGTVFEIFPTNDYTEEVLHDFNCVPN